MTTVQQLVIEFDKQWRCFFFLATGQELAAMKSSDASSDKPAISPTFTGADEDCR